MTPDSATTISFMLSPLDHRFRFPTSSRAQLSEPTRTYPKAPTAVSEYIAALPKKVKAGHEL
jgi:hypothetical protein